MERASPLLGADGLLRRRRDQPHTRGTSTPSAGESRASAPRSTPRHSTRDRHPRWPNQRWGAVLWVDPRSNARFTADAWRASRPADAAQMDKIAAHSQVRWFGNWNTNVQADVDAATSAMSAPVPLRSSSPTTSRSATAADVRRRCHHADAYRTWIAALASGIGARRAAVILEPDALAGWTASRAADQALRLDLFNFAVAADGHGHRRRLPRCRQPALAFGGRDGGAPRERGRRGAQGFALNVSNFVLTAENVAYGTQISALAGGRHFVIDTGRNGAGGTARQPVVQPRRPRTRRAAFHGDRHRSWMRSCGSRRRARATAPAAGPPPGNWMPEYALGLAKRAAY